jgi:hypothetical protein
MKMEEECDFRGEQRKICSQFVHCTGDAKVAKEKTAEVKKCYDAYFECAKDLAVKKAYNEDFNCKDKARDMKTKCMGEAKEDVGKKKLCDKYIKCSKKNLVRRAERDQVRCAKAYATCADRFDKVAERKKKKKKKKNTSTQGATGLGGDFLFTTALLLLLLLLSN